MYAREIGGRKLTLGVSGALWKDSLVMYDRETGTYWSQVDGEAMKGKLAGNRLEQIPARVMTWGEWRRLHPDTLILKKDAAITESHYAGYVDDPSKMGIFGRTNPDPRLDGKQMVLGVRLMGDTMAFAHDDLEERPVANARLGGRAIVVAYDSRGRSATAYHSRAGGRSLTFDSGSTNPRIVKDDQTGSTWNLLEGAATGGPLKGARLEEMPVLNAYWFTWAIFHPETEVWKPKG